MKSNLPNFNFKGSQRILAALLASSAVFATGCANMATTAIGTGSLGQAATVGGSVHGGNQPVAFATVNLWYAGQNGAAIIGATTTTANDGAGSFHFIKDSTNGEPPPETPSPAPAVTRWSISSPPAETPSTPAATP